MFAPRCVPKYPINILLRLHSTEAPLASSAIRSRFIEYFVNENNHSYVRSCPLKPISDETIPFVNAGMVQFKSVLQGQTLPPALRVANSQKCARVGGKHNDLDTVGMDGYHHTFFEMLGNWSFGSCDKKEACTLAWELLTGPYGLHPKRLYVTYFEGDSQMDLKPDLETKEIWRQLNVEESHILPFGPRENFWEMGLVGPCGPCTEIHVDHVPGRHNVGERVNAGFPDLTELWNIVFIEYKRNADGSLNRLKQSHVDTGMGFERLVAVLNGVESNYDTDLFIPLMDTIHKATGLPAYSRMFDPSHDAFERDRAYRILCDHIRLLTVALADNVVPHNEYKLRWVLRRALKIATDFMKKDVSLLVELTNIVSDSLHSVFPEVGKNLSKVQRVIREEAEIYQALKQEFPKTWVSLVNERPEVESLLEFGSNRIALASAFVKMNSNPGHDVSPELAFHLFDSHGLTTELIGEMAKLSGKSFDVVAYENELAKTKNKSKLATASGMTPSSLASLLASAEVPETYYNLMYEYDPLDEGYSFPPVSAKVVGLLVNGKLQKEVPGGEECGVILDRTNFYHTAGGQECDSGEIISASKSEYSLSVKEVTKVGDYVIHFGNLTGRIKVGDEVVTKICETNRVACMRNHTLAHLINGEMQSLFDAPIQKKCIVGPSFLKLNYYLHGEEFKTEHAQHLEDAILHAVEDELPVDRYTVNVWQLPAGTLLVPDESYPADNIHIIDIKRGNKTISKEACCGTHVQNTKDIGKFCIGEVILKAKEVSVCALTGPGAEKAIENSQKLSNYANDFVKGVMTLEKNLSALEREAKMSRCIPPLKLHIDEVLKLDNNHETIRTFIQENRKNCSYVTYQTVVTALEEGSKRIHNMARYISELEIHRRVEESKVVAHVMQLSELLEKVPLNKYTRGVKIPIMLFALRKNELKVRCCIPEELISENFNANQWMEKIVPILFTSENDIISERREVGLGATSLTVVYRKKMSESLKKERLWKASAAANRFAMAQIKNLSKRADAES